MRAALQPLGELMASSRNSQVENWPASVLASCQIDGQTYGLPATAGSYAMVYNQELFEARGLPSAREEFPKTWDELRRFSAEITEWDGDTLVKMGMMPPRQTVEYPIWVATNGGQIYDAETFTYQLDSDPSVEYLTWLVEWLDDEYRGDMVQVDLANNWAEIVIDVRPPAFQAGLLGMMGNGFWFTGEFYNHGEATWERWNAAQYPVGPSGTETSSGYWPNWMVVPAQANNPAEGFGYLDFISVDGMEIWFQKIPDLPTNTKVPPLTPQATLENRGEEFTAAIVEFFTGQLEVATSMWTSPIQDFADDQIARVLERAYAHQGAPRDLLAEAQTACQAELDRVLASREG
ncbi:MAG: extracellular solute-binding protein [Chloroflexia bacterium]|nr:extracellular solute-binding protein [Chloroflexia bacterium]